MSSPTYTKALVATAINSPLELQDVVLSSIQPDEALVEVHAVGVCHAELSVLNGTIPLDFPRVLGHEGAGIVKQTGSAIKGVKQGAKVILSFNHCRGCVSCEQGLPGYCPQMWERNWLGKRADGSNTLSSTGGKDICGNFFGQSSFSRLAIVNAACIVPMPDSLSLSDLKVLAPLGCGVQTGVGTIINTLNVQEPDSVAVFGVGAVGMSAIMGAKMCNTKIIVAIDLHAERLELAKDLGATHAIRGDANDIIDQLNTICGSQGLRYAMDTTGAAPVIQIMVKTLGKRGKAAFVGAMAPGTTVAFEQFDILNNGKQIVGAIEGDSDPKVMVPWLVQKWRDGELPMEKVVKHYDAERVEEAMEDMRSGKTIKPVLLW